MAYHTLNFPSSLTAPSSPPPTSFHLKAQTGTDIWRKPPSTDSFNAPIFYQKVDVASFTRARLTVSSEWKALYEQGGLCFVLNGGKQWVKSGIEFTHGKAHVSTVACDRWADWSLLPLDGNEVTIEMERETKDGKPTTTLWIYAVQGEERRPLREVTWAFEKEEVECWIGVYAAKPLLNDDPPGRELQVEFRGLEIVGG